MNERRSEKTKCLNERRSTFAKGYLQGLKAALSWTEGVLYKRKACYINGRRSTDERLSTTFHMKGRRSTITNGILRERMAFYMDEGRSTWTKGVLHGQNVF